MKKKILILIVAIVTIINLFSVAFLYFDFVSVKMPETTIKVEVIEINSNEAIIQTTIDFYNPNSFEIITENLDLITKTPDENVIVQIKIDGGSIPPEEKKTFTKAFEVNFNGSSPETLETEITGIIGIKSGFIQKTMPISVNIVTIMGDVIRKFTAPTANVRIDFGEISQKSVNLSIVVETYNPNAFDIELEDVLITVETEISESVGEFQLAGGTLVAGSYLNLSGNGTIVIEALNAEMIIVNMSTKVTATIAGFSRTLPVYVKTIVGVPDLEELLPSKLPTTAVVRVDFRVTLRGLACEVALESHNPNKIEFAVKDITFSIHRVDRNTKRLLSECTIEDGVIKAEDVTIFTGKLIIPYRKLFIPPPGGKIIADWLEVGITANMTLKGLNNYVWIGVVGYQDAHPFRRDKIYTSPEVVAWE